MILMLLGDFERQATADGRKRTKGLALRLRAFALIF